MARLPQQPEVAVRRDAGLWRLQALGWGGALLMTTGMGGILHSPAGEGILVALFRSVFGFVASSVVPIEAIRDVGVFGALGVLIVNFAALSLLPALIALFHFAPGRRQLAEGIGSRLGGALVRISLRRGGLVRSVM